MKIKTRYTSDRKLLYGIALMIILFSILNIIDIENHYTKSITQKIQIKVSEEFNSLNAEGERFVYYKGSIISWTDNNITLPKDFSPIIKSNFIKLSNGYYILKQEKKNDSIILYVSLIKKEYPIKNSYLRNEFNPKFDIEHNSDIDITLKKNNYPIKLNGEEIFYLDFSNFDHNSNSFLSYILSFLYLFIVFLISKLILSIVNPYRKYTKWISIILAYIILFVVLKIFDIYSLICNVEFSKLLVVINNFEFSVIEIFTIQILIYFILSNLDFKFKSYKSKLFNQTLLIPITWTYFYLIKILLEGFNKPISLADIINFDGQVIILLLQIMLGSYTLYIVAKNILIQFDNTSKFSKWTSSTLILYSILSIIFVINKLPFVSILAILISIFILFLSISKEEIAKKKLSPILYYVIILILYSIINGVFIYSYNNQKEMVFLKTALNKISKSEDKEVEAILLKIEKQIYSDKQINSIESNKTNKELEIYILNNYLQEINKIYSTDIIVCYSDEALFIPPLGKHINSKEYFKTRVQVSRLVINSKSIYRESTDLTEKAYIGYFELNHQNRTRLIFIDCIEKKASKEMGYPDLLINQEAKEKYSQMELDYYGVYQHNNLVLQFGNYNYSMSLNYTPNNWYKENGYLHYVVNNLRNNTIWVGSIKEQTLFDKLSIPSYLFLFSSIILLIIILILNPRRIFSIGGLTLSNSLQITLISIFLISFIVFGSIAIKYFNQLNDKTNKDILIEKTQSINYEIKDIFENPKLSNEDIYYELVNLSNTFLTDINLYDNEGFLLNTSRPTIFSQGIISRYINSDALKQLKGSTSPLIYQKERIGNRDYYASYMRIVNKDQQEIGYLHIPYIIKQKNLEDKILEFISAFINIYILWITLVLIVSILLSNFITRPLRQLQEKLHLVQLDKQNEKIKWKRKDELGNLILSYNSMIEKLDESAKLLLKKEREGAWREMAKQVAHDIKNPLTPMKLSIQQLQRLQSTDIVKFHELFQEVTPALIEQINTLSEIASEFSDYAKDKINLNEITNIDQCLRSTINIYENQDNIKINYSNPFANTIQVIGDKQQYIRIFNNLIKNSVQALHNKEDGLIEIFVEKEDDHCKISIKDNGSGINPENIDKVFSTQFTTKTDGSGLGLSIVKSIIEMIGGEIDFVSQENKGTTFNVYLPIWKQ
ncbi:MAG: HAMP domain-containing histidine kinase [Bacteroidales bacterium]|nr:HAMP domain-containing histidine kinase [Bacteroidales bacterium]MDY4789843.1 HAMP domain-containing sensor histidine kinase [Bacteroidales bacterium]